MKKTGTITAAVCQFNIGLGAIDRNLDAAEAAIDRACGQGAELVVLPELWSCGFDIEQMAGHAEKTPRVLERIGKLSAKHGAIIAGSLPEREGDAVFNTLFVQDAAGTEACRYRKIHLFSLMAEDRCFSRGNRPVICKTPFGRLGLAVCYDLRFPELCRSLAVNGAEIIVISAQWPAARIDHWDALLRARAIENQMFVMAANRCGSDEGSDLEFNGHSKIISPGGAIIADGGEAPGEAIAEIDFSEINLFRKRFSTIDERVPDAYDF